MAKLGGDPGRWRGGKLTSPFDRCATARPAQATPLSEKLSAAADGTAEPAIGALVH